MKFSVSQCQAVMTETPISEFNCNSTVVLFHTPLALLTQGSFFPFGPWASWADIVLVKSITEHTRSPHLIDFSDGLL